MYGRISDPGLRRYPPRGTLALCTSPSQSVIGWWDWDFHIVRGGVDPGNHRFRPQVVGVVEVWKDLGSGDGTLSSRRSSGFVLEPQSIGDLPMGWGFHTVQGGDDPGDHRFRPRVFRVVDVWKDF